MYVKIDKMIEDINLLNSDELNRVIDAVKLRRNSLHACLLYTSPSPRDG